MTIALFIADAGQTSGLGHLRRCAALANEFRDRKIDCVWVLTDETARKLITREGMTAVERPEELEQIGPVNIVVMDNKQQTAPVPKNCNGTQAVRCVIDDLAGDPIDADIVVNPNCYGSTLRYDLSDDCLLLCGPAYSLVEPRLVALRASRDARQNRRILITFGGTDDGKLGAAVAEKIYAAKVALPPILDLVLPPPRPAASLVAQVEAAGVVVHRDADMAALYASARIVISGASVTMVEAAAAGIPSIACRTAPDQSLNTIALRELGLVVLDQFNPQAIADATAAILADGSSNPITELIDGLGPARIANAIVARMKEKAAKEAVPAYHE